MECTKCGSENTYRFTDAFGSKRAFCRRCSGSWLEQPVLEFGTDVIKDQGPMKSSFHQNSRAMVKTGV